MPNTVSSHQAIATTIVFTIMFIIFSYLCLLLGVLFFFWAYSTLVLFPNVCPTPVLSIPIAKEKYFDCSIP